MLLSGIGKRYGKGPWVLSGVDLELSAGEAVAVVGGNGAGKSTLLRIMVGISRPTAGVVRDRPPSIGYVPDRFPPHERMSAHTYLSHMGRVRGMTTDLAQRRADELLARLVLVGGPDTPLCELSRGNAQKVALAQALLLRPNLLVLDEPWSGLDASAHGALGEIIADVCHGGGCVVFTDHRESVAATRASRMLRIADGALAEEQVAPLVEAVRIELRVVEEDAVDLAELPGVLDLWEQQDGVVVVAVDGKCGDDVLRAALDGGWSVLTVLRTAVPDVIVPDVAVPDMAGPDMIVADPEVER